MLIVAPDVEGQALAALIANSVRGTMKVAAVRAPKYGEERRNIMKDLAASVGATLVSREAGMSLKEVKLNDFGQAKSLTLTKGWTTIVGGKGDWEEIDTRIAAIKNEIQQTENLQECERLQERITRLASGVAVIRVGAATEVEMIEKKHRIDDALGGCQISTGRRYHCRWRCSAPQAITGLSVTQTMTMNEPVRPLYGLWLGKNLIINAEDNMCYDFLNRKIINAFETGVIDRKEGYKVCFSKMLHLQQELY